MKGLTEESRRDGWPYHEKWSRVIRSHLAGERVDVSGFEDVPRRAVLRRVVPIHPYGMSVYATAGGAASSDTTVWVEAPKDMPLAAPSLQILVGPTIQQSLLDVLFGAAPSCEIDMLRSASALDSPASAAFT